MFETIGDVIAPCGRQLSVQTISVTNSMILPFSSAEVPLIIFVISFFTVSDVIDGKKF